MPAPYSAPQSPDVAPDFSQSAPVDPSPTSRRPRGARIAVTLLSIALAAVSGALAFYLVQLAAANALLEKKQQQIEEQEILIDKKETFGASMDRLMHTLREFDGMLLPSLIPFERFEETARNAWRQRHSPASLDIYTASISLDNEKLQKVLATAQSEAAGNATGTTDEAVIDELSSGFATVVFDDADALCETDVLACVVSDEPTVIHVDSKNDALPYMTGWLRTGLAYHEFAHVLQNTNPGPTETAVEAFGGDRETMADCFALTFLDGWTLDHTVWVSGSRYWKVNIGYGYTCNDEQRQTIRNWYDELGFTARSISQ